ncbi:hypothetical protein [Nocardia sp. NPDC003963]
MRASEQPEADTPPATSWVRTALQQCAVLETARSLAPGTKPLLVFAIRWAPFGGATAEEVFLTFGVTRRKFLQMTVEALDSRAFDDPRMGRLKKQLSLTLTRAWRADPTGAPLENSVPPR